MRNLLIYPLFFFCLFSKAEENVIYNLKFDLSNWPTATQENLLKNIPELKQNRFTDEEINVLVKKVYSITHMKKIRILKNSTSLLLQAETDSKVDEIVFKKTPYISEADAIEILNLNLYDAADTNKVNYAIDKLLNYYKNLGYQKAKGQFEYINTPDFKKKLSIKVDIGPQTIIQALTFSGLAPEDVAVFKNNIYWNYVGENFTDDRLKKINIELRSQLNAQGLFLVGNLSPQIIYNSDDTKVTLVYKFLPKPKYEVEINGNRNFSEYNLKADVLKLDEYSPTDDSFPDEILSKLQKFYLSQGYNNAEIKYALIKKGNKNILTYNVRENAKTFIYQIKVFGSLSRSESFYINKFEDYASQAVQDGLFIKADIDQATKNLVVALKNEGFVNAKLKKLDLSLDIDHSERGLISINLDEGLQTKISEIHFKNNKSFDDQKLIAALQLSDPRLLNLNELEAGLAKLRTFYANQGYLEMKIVNLNSEQLIQYSDDLSQARINIEITEGPQIYVNSILIDGNNKTHERVILEEIEFKPGDLLTLQRLEESTARLQKTGLFSSIEIKMLENNTSIPSRTVLITLGERKPGIITTGVGLTNENNYTLHGYSGIAYRNIGGWGRGVSLRGEGSYNPSILNFLESKFTIGFLEPYLLGTRLRFRLNYTTSRTVSDYTIRQKTITNQAIWSIEQDITSHLTGIWQIYNIANYVDEGITREDEIKYGYNREDMVIASMGPTLDLEYRDNALNPTSGNFSRLTLEYATGALGSIHIDDFLRATAQTTFYTSLTDQVVWANSVRGGVMHPLKVNSEGVRFDKKGFILGGRTTIRGFESTEFFPSTDPTNPNSIGPTYKLTGNTSYEVFKSELRFPLMRKSDLAGAIFYDGGQVNIDDLPSTINYKTEWRSSVGIGIRYNLPIGPLNLEYAQKLNKKSYESDGAFHLSVGVF